MQKKKKKKSKLHTIFWTLFQSMKVKKGIQSFIGAWARAYVCYVAYWKLEGDTLETISMWSKELFQNLCTTQRCC